MNRTLFLAAGIFVASVMGGLALNLGGGTTPWMVSRVSGVVSFVLLSASVIFGLFLSTKASDQSMPRAFVFSIHQFVSVLTLAFLSVHAGSLLFDGFFNFGPLQLVVPFAAPYEPLFVGLGVIAGWLAALVTASFWMRGRIGQKTWRKLHYASFGAYVLALGHGVFSGTDSTVPLVAVTYLASVSMVVGLIAYRIRLSSRPASQPAKARRRSPAKAA